MKSGYFSEDIEIFFELLAEFSVKYMIVGGEAVIYYGYPRLTGDVDIFYSSDQSNIKQLYQALLKFWNDDIPGINEKSELSTPGYIIQFGIPPNRIDLMNTIDGIDFDEAWENRRKDLLTIKDKKIPVYYLGLDELILNKSKSGRDKDLDDLDYLKNL